MAQRIHSFFASSQELRQLSGKVQQLRAYQSHYEQVAPPSMLRSSAVLHIEHSIITLAASNSAVAAKLRQMTPELIRQLQLQGCEVTGIQVRVQVTIPRDTPSAAPAFISDTGRKQINELAKSLEDSPLKNALQRLAAKRQGR